MTKKTVKVSPITAEAIERLNGLTRDRLYSVSFNHEGDLTSVTTIGTAPTATKVAASTHSVPQDLIDRVVDQCLSNTQAGSMVMGFDLTTGEPMLSHDLGVGYVYYAKKPLGVGNSVEEAIVQMMELLPTYKDLGLVLRYKRRQGKWFVHVGGHIQELPADFDPATNENFRAYDLTSRSHVWSPKVAD